MCFRSRCVLEGIPGLSEFRVCMYAFIFWVSGGVVGLLVNGIFIKGGKGDCNGLRRLGVQILERCCLLAI